MGTIRYLLIFAVATWVVLATASAQTISIDRLTFDNQVERELFTGLAASKLVPDPVDLFSMMGPDANYNTVREANELVDAIASRIKESMSKKKTVPKQLEYLQQVLHEEYLKKYKLVANFSELVHDGTFNCVTGTALFALVLDRLGISFQIYEKPDHVYLTASDEATIIESTDPKEGVFTPDDRFRKALINSLVSAKIITNEELEAKGERAVFTDAILTDHKIDLRQLAGLQYRNDALIALQASKWELAYRQYLKSSFLYPCEGNSLMVFISSLMNLAYGGTKGLDRVVESLYIMKDAPSTIQLDRIHAMVEEEVEIYVKEHHSQDDWAALEPLLRPYQDDTLIYQQAQFRVLGAQFDACWDRNKHECFPIAQQLYQLKPWHAKVRNCLIDSYLCRFSTNNDFLALLDSLDGFGVRYPFAPSNDIFHSAHLVFLLGVAGSKFEADERKFAEPYLARFEQKQALRPGTQIAEIIGSVYAAAVRSYFRLPDYANAKRCLQKGLELAPFSNDINAAKRSFGKELGVQ